MQANLSRIHHMIKNAIEEYDRLANRIAGMRLEFSFSILEKTEESDYQDFRSRLEKRKEEFAALSKKMDKLLAYADYLKMEIATANEKFGINPRLTRASSLGRQIRNAANLVGLVNEKHELDLNPTQPMEFYKSAFTDRDRIYNLTVYLFDEKDLEKLRREHRLLLKEQQALNDELAALNQTHSLEIADFEEFCRQNGQGLLV